METDYGISSYLGNRDVGVSCVMKELYSDFIVQEILGKLDVLEDKSVLRIATPADLKECVKEEEKGLDESVAVPSMISDEQLASLDALNKDSKPLLIPTENLSKDDRRVLHEFVRLRYRGRLNSETKEKGIEISYYGLNSQTRKRKRWHKDLPDQCHFTLAKENKDTNYALGVLAKFLNVTVNTFRTHGIKDRRAVTAQRVSCNRVEKERILSLNSRLRDILVYDFNYDNEVVRMGGHWGNRFSIILRSISPDMRDVLEARLKEFIVDGFINYFGTQRFGSCGTNTASVGKLILRRDWEGAVKLILSNEHLPGYLGTVGDAVRCWEETQDASKALRFLKGGQAYASIEAIIFKHLAKGGTWQTCITDALPMNLRSLYVHAYQSLLWNKVASRRIAEHGAAVHQGDLGFDGKKISTEASPFDICIPLPGKTVAFEDSYGVCFGLSRFKYLTVSQWYEDMLTEDGLTNCSFSSLEESTLSDGISTRAIPESEMVGDLMALQVQFGLPSGCYATVALRQITGTDMGKQSMKMKLSVKNRADGSVIQIEIDQNETIGDLRSKIASQLGNSVDAHSIRLSLGAEELNHDDSVVIKKSGLVSGDRLFLESYVHFSPF
uniref:TRUD domain-containing protein n=1 Tax=Heligmosomoides polygyrus TaxID=6339 RepID=A0A183G684_HELPZ